MEEHAPRNEEQAEPSKELTFPADLASRKREPFLEEIEILKIEGRYFCFDPRASSKRNGKFKYRDREASGDRELVIETHPSYGHPSVLAYRVLQSIFRKITIDGGPAYKSVVTFSMRELARLCGRDIYGGKDGVEIYGAIQQLRNTDITYVLYDKDGTRFKAFQFKIVRNCLYMGEGDGTAPRHISALTVEIDSTIIDRMRLDHYAVFDWYKIERLEPLAAAMYKRLYYNFSCLYQPDHASAWDGLQFTKDYAALCAEWLGGLTVRPHLSLVKRQLLPHLEALKQSGLIRSFTVEPNKARSGFNVSFLPGRGFKDDYDLFYGDARQGKLLLRTVAEQPQIQAPLEGIAYFYRRAKGIEKLDQQIIPERQVTFAKQLIAKYGDAGFRDLVDYAVAKARTTKFDMQTVNALKVYETFWQASLVEREQEIARRRHEEHERREQRRRADYDAYRKAEIFRRVAALTPTERTELERQADVEIASTAAPASNPQLGLSFARMNKTLFINRKMSEKAPIPNFEEWLAAQD